MTGHDWPTFCVLISDLIRPKIFGRCFWQIFFLQLLAHCSCMALTTAIQINTFAPGLMMKPLSGLVFGSWVGKCAHRVRFMLRLVPIQRKFRERIAWTLSCMGLFNSTQELNYDSLMLLLVESFCKICSNRHSMGYTWINKRLILSSEALFCDSIDTWHCSWILVVRLIYLFFGSCRTERCNYYGYI